MSSASRYALLYSEYEVAPLLRYPFEKFSTLIVLLPLFAFFFCIIYSVGFHFDSATYTHCHVFNLLPSISAAIGNFTPQRQVWQTAILLHAIPRFIVAFMYFKRNQNILPEQEHWLASLAYFLNVTEISALVILSLWTSSRHYAVHEKAFITFVLMSEFYMIVTCIIQRRSSKKANKNSLKWKQRFLMINISCILIATYCFIRHNSLCEPYVYTFFALAEYIVVLTNMAFHTTAYWDFKHRDLILYRYGITITER